MLAKTQAIVLNHLKYNDSSVIVHLYTSDYGRLSVIVKGLASKKGRTKLVLFSTLNLLDIELNYQPKRQIQTLRNFRLNPAYVEIPYKTSKSTLALFLGEVFMKCLREEEANASLFEFLRINLLALDHLEQGLANFHLYLLVHMSRFLGFYPQKNYNEQNNYFDLYEGKYSSQNVISPYMLDENLSSLLFFLQQKNITSLGELKISRSIRIVLLEKLITYYQLHLEGFGELKSLKILNEVFY